MAVSASVLINIDADTRKAQDGIERTSKAFGGLSTAIGKLGSGVMDRLIIDLGDVADMALDAGGAAIGLAADYEQAMNLLDQNAGATSAEMAALGAQAKALGSDLELPGTSAGDAAAAMLELSRAGLNVNDIMGASRGVLQLSAAGQLDNAEAAEIAANALMAFGLEGSKATMVADMLAAAANASSMEVGDVAAGFQMASSVFSSFQGPIVGAENAMLDLTTALAVMANAGIKGSDAGTSLKQMLMQLAGPSDEAKGMMKDLALRVGESGDIAYTASGQMRPLEDIIRLTAEATADMTDEQRQNYLTTIYGADASRAMIVLMGSMGAEAQAAGRDFDTMREAVSRQGAAGEAAAARMEGLSGAVEGFKSQLETAALNGIEPWLPLLTDMVQGASAAVGEIGDMAAGMAPLVGVATTAAGVVGDLFVPAMAGLTAAASAHALVVTSQQIPALTASTTAFFANIGAQSKAILVANSATIAYAGIGVAIAGMVIAFDRFNEKVESANQQMLANQQWWEASATTLDQYNQSAEYTQQILKDKAQLVERERAEIERNTETLGRMKIMGQLTAEQEREIMAAINQKVESLKTHEAELRAGLATYDEQHLRQYDAIEDARAERGAIESLTTAIHVSDEARKEAQKTLEQVAIAGPKAFDALTTSAAGFYSDLQTQRMQHEQALAGLTGELRLAQTTEERAAIEERIAAENEGHAARELNLLASHQRQTEMQRQALGQQLLDYAQAQAAMTSDPAVKARWEELTGLITEQYGIQQSAAEQSFAQQTTAMLNYAQTGTGSLDTVSGTMQRTEEAAARLKEAEEALTGYYIAELQHNFDPAIQTTEELQRAMDNIPKQVAVDIAIGTEQTMAYAHSVGANISAGITEGIIEGYAWIDQAVIGAVASAKQSAEGYAQIRSPSRLFALSIGVHIPAGIAAGIEESAHLIGDAVVGALGDANGSDAVKSAIDLVESIGSAIGTAAEGLTTAAGYQGIEDGVLAQLATDIHTAIVELTSRLSEVKGIVEDETVPELLEISEGVLGALGSMVDLSEKLKTTPYSQDLRDELEALSFGLRDAAVDFWHRAEEIKEVLADQSAPLFAETTGLVIETVGKGAEALTALSGFVAPSRATLEQFSFSLRDIAVDFWHRAQEIDEVLASDAAPTFAAMASSTVSTISEGVTALTALADFQAPPRAALESFSFTLRDAVADFWHRAQEIETALNGEAVPQFASTASTAVETISTAVDAFTKLADFEAPPRQALESLSFGIQQAVTLMVDMSGRFNAEGVAAAATFAESIGAIVAPIKPAIDGFSALAEYQGIAPGRMQMLGADIEQATLLMTDIATRANTEGVARATEFSTAVKTQFEAMKSGIEALNLLRDYESIPQERLGALQSDFGAAMAMLTSMAGQADASLVQAQHWQTTLESVAGAIRAGANAIAALDGLTVSSNINVALSATASGGGDSGGDSAQAMWSGGEVAKGQRYRTGELGVETFVPWTDGVILNNHETRELERGRRGGDTTIINIDARGSTLTKREIRSVVDQALDEKARRADSRRRS